MDGRNARLSRFSFLVAVGLISLVGTGVLCARADLASAAGIEPVVLGPVASVTGPTLAATPTALPTVREIFVKEPLKDTPTKEILSKEPAGTQPSETVAATHPAPETTAASIEHTPIRAASKTDETPAKDGAAAGRSGGMMSGLYSAMQVAAALAIVVGLILIGRALMRKFVPGAAVGSGKGVIETLARYPIGRSQSVVLLRIGSQIVALNQTKDQSQSILVISEPVEVAKIIGQIEGQDPTSIQASFNRVLSNARMDLEQPDTMDVMDANKSITTADDDLDTQLEEMAAAKRQLIELRAQVRSVRESMPA